MVAILMVAILIIAVIRDDRHTDGNDNDGSLAYGGNIHCSFTGVK